MMTSTESIPTSDRTTSDRPGIDFAGPCDLAIWCKLLHDKGWSGPRIARAIAKSEGYVNNLIRVVERASPSVLLRWRAEQNGLVDHVCATDWLISVCLWSHERQDEDLQRRITARASLRAGSEGIANEAANEAVNEVVNEPVNPAVNAAVNGVPHGGAHRLANDAAREMASAPTRELVNGAPSGAAHHGPRSGAHDASGSADCDHASHAR